jgi:hypothetical protein
VFVLFLLVASSPIWAQVAEGDRSNVFLYGVDLSTEYDDQVAGAAGPGQVIYSLQPRMAFRISRPRWTSRFDYLPMFIYSSQPSSSYDLMSNSGGFTVERRFSKRFTVALQNNFAFTSNPFDTLRANSQLPEFDPLDRPNSTAPGGTLSRRMDQARGTLSYKLDAHSVVGIGCNYMYLDYRGIGAGFAGPSRTISKSIDAFYDRQLGRHLMLGFRYTFQELDFGHGTVKTDSHRLLNLWTVGVTPSLTVSAFVGPDYSDTRNYGLESPLASRVHAVELSAVGGATLRWTRAHGTLAASAIRQISDGGGTGGNVLLDTFDARASRKVSRRASVSSFFTFNRNQRLLPLLTSLASFNYVAGGAEFHREITSQTFVTLFYWRIGETEVDRLNGLPSGNRIGIRLSYGNVQAIGR